MIKTNLTEFKSEMLGKVQAVLIRAANDGIASMQERVSKGIDANGQKMPAYSEGYKARKEAQGRRADTRNLEGSGQLLRSIHVADVKEDGDDLVAFVRVGGARNREIGIYNQKIAPWFGWSDEDKETIAASLKAGLKKEFG